VTVRIALTFDAEHPDRPHRPGGTERVLATLAATGTTASFFVQGRWAEAFPGLARSIADGGHLVGNHSHYHVRMPLLSARGLAADVRAAERAIRRATGKDPRPWFRCPFGAGTDDPAVLGALERLGYRETGWDVDGLDWRSSATGRRLASEAADAALRHGDGAVILLHPWTTATGRALPALIDRVRAGGGEFVRLDALS
jgi:peptidoglycan/xylan/chitin deacetylase (PgdA/CDA1 family)